MNEKVKLLWAEMVKSRPELSATDTPVSMTPREILRHVERAYRCGELNEAQRVREGLRKHFDTMFGWAWWG